MRSDIVLPFFNQTFSQPYAGKTGVKAPGDVFVDIEKLVIQQ
jgi:hypothetical protein